MRLSRPEWPGARRTLGLEKMARMTAGIVCENKLASKLRRKDIDDRDRRHLFGKYIPQAGVLASSESTVCLTGPTGVDDFRILKCVGLRMCKYASELIHLVMLNCQERLLTSMLAWAKLTKNLSPLRIEKIGRAHV